MINLYLLREYILQSLREEKQHLNAGEKLRVFDFDDTLVKTGSLIHVISAAGEKFDLTPGQYAVYTPQEGDQFDYSDFEKLINPQAISWTVNILRNLAAKGSQVVILTARSAKQPVEQFLNDAGLPPYEVVALGNANPQAKADWISSKIQLDNIKLVEFFDDSEKNVAAVQELKKQHPDVKITSRQVTHKSKI
jgi:hypothetical protein